MCGPTLHGIHCPRARCLAPAAFFPPFPLLLLFQTSPSVHSMAAELDGGGRAKGRGGGRRKGPASGRLRPHAAAGKRRCPTPRPPHRWRHGASTLPFSPLPNKSFDPLPYRRRRRRWRRWRCRRAHPVRATNDATAGVRFAAWWPRPCSATPSATLFMPATAAPTSERRVPDVHPPSLVPFSVPRF